MPLPTPIRLEERSGILDTGQHQVAGRHAARSAFVKLSVAMASLSSAAMTGPLTVRLVTPVSAIDDHPDSPRLVPQQGALYPADDRRRALTLPLATQPANTMPHAEYR